MKFLCLAYYDTEKFAALPREALQGLVSQCPAYDATLRASGALRLQASLGDPTATRTLRPGRDQPSVTDGPFVETKEQVGGFIARCTERDAFTVDAVDLGWTSDEHGGGVITG